MRHWADIAPPPDFSVLASTDRSQVATMVLAPDEATGGPGNAHETADQWLYVLAGEGRAVVTNEAVVLGPGTLVLIEAGESHEIRNLGDDPLETLNFYAPPTF